MWSRPCRSSPTSSGCSRARSPVSHPTRQLAAQHRATASAGYVPNPPPSWSLTGSCATSTPGRRLPGWIGKNQTHGCRSGSTSPTRRGSLDRGDGRPGTSARRRRHAPSAEGQPACENRTQQRYRGKEHSFPARAPKHAVDERDGQEGGDGQRGRFHPSLRYRGPVDRLGGDGEDQGRGEEQERVGEGAHPKAGVEQSGPSARPDQLSETDS